MIKFLLDSGDPEEYKAIARLAQSHGQELWGSTTNPSLIAKKLTGQKLTPKDAFALQKELVLQIVQIVPGAVSAEVYADLTTTAEDMVAQGRTIASWHKRVVVKLPTTIEGLRARNILRREGITINNTLVFSQEQVFAITMQEQLLQKELGKSDQAYPCFISPFVGRLDDKGQNGMSFVRNSMDMLDTYFPKDLVWMLIASVRTVDHMAAGLASSSQLVTVPTHVYTQWFALSKAQQDAVDFFSSESQLQSIPVWQPTDELLAISSVDQLMHAIMTKKLNITHQLTTQGIEKFVADWQNILTN